MRRLEYVSSKGVSVPLDGPDVSVGIAAEPRGRKWAYNIGYRNVRMLSRPARAVKMSITMPYAQADAMRKAFDADVYANTPGEFVIDGDWHQRALVLEQKVGAVHGGRVFADITAALLDGAWWRLVSVPFVPDTGQDPETYTYLDYNFDYEIDYGVPSRVTTVHADATNPSPVRIVVYGPASNPAITAGGNVYEVDVSVPAGGYLLVDGKKKEITLVGADGSVTNAFGDALRGSGEGGGQYIFEPVPTSEININWDNSFGFDFGWYQEEGEPPWAPLS